MSTTEHVNAGSGGSMASAGHGAVLRLLDRPVSAAELAASAEEVAKPAEVGARRTQGVLLFRLDEETLAVEAKLLRRITPFTSPSPVPHRSSGILRGLCNIRGELVLCADLRRLLGLPARKDVETPVDGASDPRRMIVIGPAEASWAFEVDALIGVERIDPAGLQPAPMTVEHAIGAFVLGLAEIDQRRVTVLDGERILGGFKAGLS